MPRLFPLSAFILVLALGGCAQLPDTDGDLSRAHDQQNQGDRLDVMRRQSEEIAQVPFVGGNKVTLLRDGAATYPAMLSAIRSAQKRIDMESFIFDEKEGMRFARALLDRRAHGVEVNLIYDAIGSDDTPPDLFDWLRSKGVHVVEYNPVDPGAIIDSSFNHRDHRKLLIIDGKTAFTGGLNVSQLYQTKLNAKHKLGLDGEELHDPERTPWRDTHVKIEGPVVRQFDDLFVETWKDQKGEPELQPMTVSPIARGDLLVQALDGTPDLKRYDIYRSLLVNIALAQKSAHLTTAFFVPTPDMLKALKGAAKRGVDVTLIVPSYSDSELSMGAQHAYYDELLESGVRIFERQNAVLHAKTAVIDGVWSTVGSSNLDWRSVLFNNECNAVILGEGFGRQMEAMFRDDLAASKPITEETWDDRPLGERLEEWKSLLVEYFL